MPRRRVTPRMRRVDEAIRQILSEEIPRLKDPGIGFVTVTAVDTTSDLEHATVWVSVLGDESERERTMAALERAAGVLQARINRELHVRRTPLLRFTYDAAIERGVHISKLIDEVAPVDEPGEQPT